MTTLLGRYHIYPFILTSEITADDIQSPLSSLPPLPFLTSIPLSYHRSPFFPLPFLLATSLTSYHTSLTRCYYLWDIPPHPPPHVINTSPSPGMMFTHHTTPHHTTTTITTRDDDDDDDHDDYDDDDDDDDDMQPWIVARRYREFDALDYQLRRSFPSQGR